jgi:hypothetical protein
MLLAACAARGRSDELPPPAAPHAAPQGPATGHPPAPHGENGEAHHHAEGEHEHEGHEEEGHGEEEHRFRLRAEYLLWWFRDTHFPPLVTRGGAADPLPGALGMPGTEVLFGGRSIDDLERSGGRFTAAWTLESGTTIEASYFFLGSQTTHFAASAGSEPGATVLARPFTDVLAGREDASLVSFPGLAAGSVLVGYTGYLHGFEANAAWCLRRGKHHRLELLAGLRYLNLDEGLRIEEDVDVVPGAPAFAGSRLRVTDGFDTRNHFYGAQVGLRGGFTHGHWDVDAGIKVALGGTHQAATVGGATTITGPGGGSETFNGGLLALPSNSGSFTQGAFGAVPEANVNVSYRLLERLRFFAGYNVLFWTDVARPADQLDLGVNRRQVPTSELAGTAGGPERPAFPFATATFWAQGVNLGLEFRY